MKATLYLKELKREKEKKAFIGEVAWKSVPKEFGYGRILS
jgi:hypothetical protein